MKDSCANKALNAYTSIFCPLQKYWWSATEKVTLWISDWTCTEAHALPRWDIKSQDNNLSKGFCAAWNQQFRNTRLMLLCKDMMIDGSFNALCNQIFDHRWQKVQKFSLPIKDSLKHQTSLCPLSGSSVYKIIPIISTIL